MVAKSLATVIWGQPLEHWLSLLRSDAVYQRREAARILAHAGNQKPEAAARSLALALSDRDSIVRMYAALALLDLGPAALPYLEWVAQCEDFSAREYAEVLFWRLRASQERPPLSGQVAVLMGPEPDLPEVN